MGINVAVFFFIVALKANLSPVGIRSSPQHERAPHMVFSMAGQASDPVVVKRKRKIERVNEDEIRRMVIFPVLMAAQTG